MAEAAAAALWEVGAAWATDAAIYVASNAAVINAVAAYAVSASYGQHQKKKAAAAGRAAYNASLEDRLVMTATTQAARSRVYGRVRNVDGIVFKATHGTTKEFYTLVIALAGHEVDAIETVYFNETPVTLDGSGYVQEAPWFVSSIQSAGDVVVVSSGSGSVTLAHTPVSGSVKAVFEVDGATAYETTPTVVGNVASITGAPANGTWNVTYQYNSGGSMARVRAYTGAPGQDLSSVLTPLVGGAITSTDKFQGMACLVVTLQYHQDAFPTGVPSISAVMRGAKVFDPRTSTTAWTQNPALIARDWALHANGGGCASGEINAAAFTAAANACDVSTTFTTTAGTETRPLFECGTVIPLDSNPDEALAEICESMAGQWGWAGGLLSVRAGVYRAPVATITEDWITSVEDIAIVSNAPTADAVNVMRPTLADAAQAYTSTPAAEVRSAAYVTADGRELPRELQLGGVTRAVHAQHVCGVLMREAREGLTVQLPCNLRAYQLELFDVVAVTLPRFGWSAKAFEVLGWRFSITGGINLTLRETAAAIYTPDATFGVLNLSANTNLATPGQVPQLTGLAATSGSVAQVDGSSIARTAITWTATTSEAVAQSGTVEIQYTPATAAVPTGDWPAAPPASGRATQVDVYGLRIGRFYIVRGRFRNTLGMAGPWSAQLVHLVEGTRAPRIFYQASTPTGDVRDGDQWFDSDDGNRQYARVSGAWVSVRDSGIAQAIADAATAQGTADGKVVTFVQTTAPTAEGVGDLWMDSDDGNKLYRWSGSAWVAVRDAGITQALTDASNAQATADGKVVTFVQTTAPTAEGVGDLWMDSDDGNKVYRWSGAAWVAVPIGTGALGANAATEIYVHTPTAAVTVTWQSTMPDAYARNTPLAEVTFTPSGSGVASVYAEGMATYVNSSSSLMGTGQFSVQDAAATYDNWKELLVYVPAGVGQTVTQAVSTTRQFAVTGGTTYTMGFVSAKRASGDTLMVENIEMRVEVIKR